MISGDYTNLLSPIRSITAKVELSCDSSTKATIQGNPITINDAEAYNNIDIQLTSDTITDFSNIGTTNGKNKLKLSSAYKEFTTRGITSTINDDMSITYTGLATGLVSHAYVGTGTGKNAQSLDEIGVKRNVNYTLSTTTILPTNCSLDVYTYDAEGVVKRSFRISENSATKICRFTDNEDYIYVYIRIPTDTDLTTEPLTIYPMLEEGEVMTEYEPYTEMPLPVYLLCSDGVATQKVAANSDGIVEGVTAYKGAFTLTTEPTSDILINATYNISADKKVFAHDGDLVSIAVDRVGENKFFGYGICQKATVTIRDNERKYNIFKDNNLNIIFDDINTLPLYYVDTVARNENTNALTVIAYDAINKAAAHTVAEISLNSYTIGELAAACAQCIGIYQVTYPDNSGFDIFYTEGANFEGTETIREALNAIAEATQTIYYINNSNELVFKRLDKENTALNIDKSQYITLENKTAVTLNAICSITELGDNVEAAAGAEGATQNIYNNPLLELRADLPQLLEGAIASVGGTRINQYNLTWRGNYLLELGDRISVLNKDNTLIYTYLLNDTITYNGGYRQVSKWEYKQAEAQHTNPTNLGDALKQTFAKVDKVNKEITLVTSESSANAAEIAALQLNTDNINASVSAVQTQVNESVDGLNETVAELSKKVNATMTSEEINIAIENKIADGASSVETSTGFTFNEEGLTISKSTSDIKTTITEDGMLVSKGDTEVLTADNEGVKAIDLHAETYLVIGKNSRFEDYGTNKERTGCFWIGG